MMKEAANNQSQGEVVTVTQDGAVPSSSESHAGRFLGFMASVLEEKLGKGPNAK